MQKGSKGFTLIEVLVIVVIIGILAAIAIPQFARNREKAFDAAARSDLRNMMTAEENYFADSGAYTDVSIGAGGSADIDLDGTTDFQASQNVSLGANAYTDGYQITSRHANSSTTWCVNSSVSSASGSISVIVQGASC